MKVTEITFLKWKTQNQGLCRISKRKRTVISSQYKDICSLVAILP